MTVIIVPAGTNTNMCWHNYQIHLQALNFGTLLKYDFYRPPSNLPRWFSSSYGWSPEFESLGVEKLIWALPTLYLFSKTTYIHFISVNVDSNLPPTFVAILG